MNHYSQIQLKQIANICADKINDAKINIEVFDTPYRHMIIDNFLPDNLAKLCLNNFPDANDATWNLANDPDIEIKQISSWKSEFDIPEGIIFVVRIMNSSLFLKAISAAIQIPKLISDPYFTGGGLNLILNGGLLDVHVDGNYHDATGLNRRANAILCLNPDWEESWGGEFGIYDQHGENCVKKVAPLFNRLIVFDSHDYSYHGLPDPINFPKDKPRRSIILYYYTKEPRPNSQIAVEKPHSALWKKRNFLDKSGNKTRKYT